MNINLALHKALHYCPGYTAFLEQHNQKKKFKLNLYFFFLSPFWLVQNKMLLVYFLNTMAYLVVMKFALLIHSNDVYAATMTYLTLFMAFHILLSFCSFLLYQYHLELKFHKAGHDPVKCQKSIKPFNPFVQFFLVLVIPFCSAVVFDLLTLFK